MLLRNDSNFLNFGNEDNWNSFVGDFVLIFLLKINIMFFKLEKVVGFLFVKFSVCLIFLILVCFNFLEKFIFRYIVVVNLRGGFRKFMLIIGKKGICFFM